MDNSELSFVCEGGLYLQGSPFLETCSPYASIEISATVFSSEGYDYENPNNVHRNLILRTLRGPKISSLVIAILNQ